jgi:hypothetical protein
MAMASVQEYDVFKCQLLTSVPNCSSTYSDWSVSASCRKTGISDKCSENLLRAWRSKW